jgi:outer membrane protein assembly factor BamA
MLINRIYRNNFLQVNIKLLLKMLLEQENFISTINGLGDDDVRLSKRKNLSTKRLRGFEKGKVGPVDGT